MKYFPRFKCIYQEAEHNSDGVINSDTFINKVYCQHSLNPEAKGKIDCPYLGKSVEMIIEGKKTKVNLCDFMNDSY
ncbi:MAG: hypothetical protein QXK80_02700 [Candidatus Pacearchaeota archaeon]